MKGGGRVDLDLAGRRLQIEARWVGPDDTARPVLVFLHEGLGSVAMWKDFPATLCDACGVRGLVYSRPGYGESTPRAAGEQWGVDFMHREAEQVLPALLDKLGVVAPYALFGHSDGGSIALIHAARFPDRVSAAVVMAPHWVVEAFGLVSIRAARDAYKRGDLREKLAKYHADVDSAFYGWNDIWLNDAFASWTIESLLPRIACPVLAIQGTDDPYGTMRQIERIAEAASATRLLKLAGCGHSPQRDQPDAVIAATRDFLNQAITGRQR